MGYLGRHLKLVKPCLFHWSCLSEDHSNKITKCIISYQGRFIKCAKRATKLTVYTRILVLSSEASEEQRFIKESERLLLLAVIAGGLPTIKYKLCECSTVVNKNSGIKAIWVVFVVIGSCDALQESLQVDWDVTLVKQICYFCLDIKKNRKSTTADTIKCCLHQTENNRSTRETATWPPPPGSSPLKHHVWYSFWVVFKGINFK